MKKNQRMGRRVGTGVLTSALVAAGISGGGARGGTFGEDVAFLKAHTRLLVLSDRSGQAQVAVAGAWQGRVMTSSGGGEEGLSYGWINRELIARGEVQPHINVYGGEDRFWLGPEGGQYSIFFKGGAKFELGEWYTPAGIDTLGYEVERATRSWARFRAGFAVTNYAGTRFEVGVRREVRVLSRALAARQLGLESTAGLEVVAYESRNRIINEGKEGWEARGGLLSVWILGMYKPGAETTIVVPIRAGGEERLGRKVTSDYFGVVPGERLVVKEGVIYFSGDGRYRSKIGINPRRSQGVMGSFDGAHGVLTIVQFTQPAGVTEYVNSLWKVQEDPYGGDAANSYNDGEPAPGVKALGPFYEMESSSPAAALRPGASLTHVHRTMHIRGPEKALDALARKWLGASLAEIKGALPKPAR